MDYMHLDAIEAVLEEAVSCGKLAGASCIVSASGKRLGSWSAGYADIAARKKFGADTICRLFSLTKPVTSVAAMILLERGQLDLADNVADIIPGFTNPAVCSDGTTAPSPRPMLIQNLLDMTSGCTYGGDGNESERRTSALLDRMNRSAAGDNSVTTMEFAQSLAEIPLSFVPGTDYQYGLSADIMGAVIEAVSGMSFGEFLRKNIFAPLGMDDTGFYVPAEKAGRLSKVYAAESGGLDEFTGCHLGIQNGMRNPPAFESGGAGLVSTAEDYIRFCRMLSEGGSLDGIRILSGKTVRFLSSSVLPPALQSRFDMKMGHLSGYSYRNFMRVCRDPGMVCAVTSKGEFGWDGWLGPYMSADPENSLSIVLMMQLAGAGLTGTARRIKNIVYTMEE